MSKTMCEGCDKLRSDVQTCGEIGMCFICRKEAQRGRYFSAKLGRYIFPE